MLSEKLKFLRQAGEMTTLILSYNTVKLVGNLIDNEGGRIELQVGHLLGRRIMRYFDLPVTVEGEQHVDRIWRSGMPYAVVSTHASYLDWALLLGFFPSPVRFIAKVELARLPGIGSFLRQRGVLIDRSKGIGARDAIKAAIADDIEWPILIFPEGTRSADGEVHPFRRGGLRLLAEAGQALLPVTIVGSHRALPPTRLSIERGCPIELHIDEPVTPEDFPDPEARIDEVERRVHERFDTSRHR